MKKHLEQVLAKRYERENRKVNKEIEEIEKGKEETKKKIEEENKKIQDIEAVQEMIKNHPSMKERLQEMLNTNNLIGKLKYQISKLDEEKDKDKIDKKKEEIEKLKEKIEEDKDEIIDYSEKNKLGVKKEAIESIMKNAVYDKEKKEININASINKTKKAIEENKKKLQREFGDSNRKIKRYNSQITINEKVIISLREETTKKEKKAKEQNNLETNKENNVKIEGTSNEQSKVKNVEVQQKQVIKAEKKPKWFQFIKRFKNWRANRKKSVSSKEEQKIQVQPKVIKNEEPQKNEAKNDFTQSLKYQVVKDIAEQMQKEKLEEIKRNHKEHEQRPER